MIRAEVIADSVSPLGHRATTIQTEFPRQILGELLMHRSHARSSASSRAVPVRKMLEQVRANPFVPLRWQSAKPGMQGGETITGEPAKALTARWLANAAHAADEAEAYLAAGVHKTMPNRLLEPFAWHTSILTATDDGWANLFAQRCSPLAEIHMEATATAMRDAYNASTPAKVADGEWHLPYITAEERASYDVRVLQFISAARCARVSYLTHDGRHDIGADLALFEKLRTAEPPHWSPMEHQATPTPFGGRQVGNLTGWSQLRHQLAGAR